MAIDAWYLVKFGGTATGDGGRVTVKPTGSFGSRATSAYYNNIELALLATTPPTKDSIGLVSDVHDFTDASHLEYARVVSSFPPLFISVLDTAIDQSSVGARERTGATSDILLNNNFTSFRTHGISFSIGDDIGFLASNMIFIVEKGSLDFGGSTDRISMEVDGCLMELIDSDITYPSGGSTGGVASIQNAGTFKMTGGAISSVSNDIDSVLLGGAINGGMVVDFNGVDLSSVSDFILEDAGASTSDDIINVRLDGCKLSATVVATDEQFVYPYQSIKITNSSSVAAAAEFQDFESTWVGDIEDQDSSGIVRIDDVTFESGENTSLQLTTTADCSIAHPLVFELSGRFTKLSTAGEDTLIIRFAVVNTVTLTDTNFYAEVLNPNGTTANQWDYVTNRNSDILAAGTEWTDDSGSSVWEDNGVNLTGHNEYRMEITISGGGDGYPIIRLMLTEPSLSGTMYISKDVGVS